MHRDTPALLDHVTNFFRCSLVPWVSIALPDMVGMENLCKLRKPLLINKALFKARLLCCWGPGDLGLGCLGTSFISAFLDS